MGIKYITTVTCPWCGEELSISREQRTIEPAVAAKVEERFLVDKVTQMTIDKFNADATDGEENKEDV